MSSADMVRAARESLQSSLDETSEELIDAADEGDEILESGESALETLREAVGRLDEFDIPEVPPELRRRREAPRRERRRPDLPPPSPPVEDDEYADAGPRIRRAIPAFLVLLAIAGVAVSVLARTSEEGSSGPAPTVEQVDASPTSGTIEITSDRSLTADHRGMIVIAADGVALDCNGHEVVGSTQSGTGIEVRGRAGVMITNCVVRGFQVGVGLWNSDDSIVTSTTAQGNVTGFLLADSSRNNVLALNAAVRNVNEGIVLSGSNRNTLEENEVSGGRQGILVDRANSNTLVGNRVVGASDWFGFGFINNARDNIVTANYAEDSGSGFAINVGARANVFTGNEAVGNVVGFNVLNDPGTAGNTFSGNTATGNSGTGIRDDTRGGNGDFGTDNQYADNTCSGNETNGRPFGLCG